MISKRIFSDNKPNHWIYETDVFYPEIISSVVSGGSYCDFDSESGNIYNMIVPISHPGRPSDTFDDLDGSNSISSDSFDELIEWSNSISSDSFDELIEWYKLHNTTFEVGLDTIQTKLVITGDGNEIPEEHYDTPQKLADLVTGKSCGRNIG